MKKVHVIHHTHWDFEWYFTRDEALIQFVYHMDEVFKALKEQKVDYYLLDGQMSILDDYLDAYPEKKNEIKKWVITGRLIIGPWYTQTDELIITGESIVRNLSLGMNLATQLGGYQKIGYLPDSFGQGADMPKIYNGMDINKAVFWRGLPQNKTTNREFIWQSEDESQVTVANIKDGYFVGVGLIESNDANALMTVISDGARTDQLLLPVGGDQRYVDYNLKNRIDSYNKQLTDIKLVESTYSKYFDDLQDKVCKLDRVSGEFIDSSVSKIHRSIYSSRYDQKYLNDKVERRMIYQVEPLMAMAEKIGIQYKKSLLDKVWKLIVRNHAHDSAGGCNSDKTNKNIIERLEEADQLSYSIVDYLTRKIAESDVLYKEGTVTFFNTLPYAIKKTAKFQLSVQNKQFKLSSEGKNIPFDIEKISQKYHGQIKRDTDKYQDEDYYYIVECVADIELPALQWCTLNVEKSNNQISKVVDSDLNKIENQFFEIHFENNQLNLVDLKRHQRIENFMYIEDSGDEGDTYDYSPAYHDRKYKLDFKNAEVEIVIGNIISKMVLTGSWQLPSNLEKRATGERNQVVEYKLTIELNGSGRIENKLVVLNNIDDHRMRIIMKTCMHNLNSYADTGFGFIKRSVEDSSLKNWKKLNYHEEPTSIFPMIHYVNVHSNNFSMSFLAKGIKEYQLIGKHYEKIALTMFRSVGFLGRPDLIRRPGVASGNQFTYIPTPESQLHQELHFKWAIVIDTQFDPALIAKNFQEYAISTPYYQAQNLNQFTNTLKYFVMHPLDRKIRSGSFFEMNNNKVNFSSLTKDLDGTSYLIRVVNMNKTKIQTDQLLILDKSYYITETNFLGKIKKDIGYSDVIENMTFKPGEIKTFKIVG